MSKFGKTVYSWSVEEMMEDFYFEWMDAGCGLQTMRLVPMVTKY